MKPKTTAPPPILSGLPWSLVGAARRLDALLRLRWAARAAGLPDDAIAVRAPKVVTGREGL